MARRPRVEVPGALHRVETHVLAERRLVDRDEDLDELARVLARVARRHDWRCREFRATAAGYVLHVETPGPTLASGMRELNSGFARFVNERDVAYGHVFAARYESEVLRVDRC